MDGTEDAVAQAAGALRESAQQHKRASAFHRRAAQKDMDALARLKAVCRRFGIKLSVDSHGGNHG